MFIDQDFSSERIGNFFSLASVAAPAPHRGDAVGSPRESLHPVLSPAAGQSLGGAATTELPRARDLVRRRRRPHGCVTGGDAG
jgi:hypothetical protein